MECMLDTHANQRGNILSMGGLPPAGSSIDLRRGLPLRQIDLVVAIPRPMCTGHGRRIGTEDLLCLSGIFSTAACLTAGHRPRADKQMFGLSRSGVDY